MPALSAQASPWALLICVSAAELDGMPRMPLGAGLPDAGDRVAVGDDVAVEAEGPAQQGLQGVPARGVRRSGRAIRRGVVARAPQGREARGRGVLGGVVLLEADGVVGGHQRARPGLARRHRERHGEVLEQRALGDVRRAVVAVGLGVVRQVVLRRGDRLDVVVRARGDRVVVAAESLCCSPLTNALATSPVSSGSSE